MYIGHKVFAYVVAGMGVIGLVNSLTIMDGYGITGSIVFLSSGIIILQLLKKVEK